jgi:hypothetical protein
MELAAGALVAVMVLVLVIRRLRRRPGADAVDGDTLAENASFAAEKLVGLGRGTRRRADDGDSGSDGGGDGGGG